MAAYVYTPTPEQWEILREVLFNLEDGGIIVPPKTAEIYKKKFGEDWQEKLDTPIDYDYGGEADCAVDFAHEGSHADDTLREELKDATVL